MAPRGVKPPQFPLARPSSARTSSTDPASRQSSFGKLVGLALRDRAVAGHFKKTHDETVRVKDDREWSPMVMVDHPFEPESVKLRGGSRVVDIKAAGEDESFPLRKPHCSYTTSPSHMGKLAPIARRGELMAARTSTTSNHIRREDYTSPDLSPLDRQLFLSDNLEQSFGVKTKLSRQQVARFRKVSAPHALHLSVPAPELSAAIHPETQRSLSVLRVSKPTPSLPLSSPGTDGASFLDLPSRDAHPAPGIQSANASTRSSPRHSSPTPDLNRPLPPLPLDNGKPTKIARARRKAVPKPLDLPRSLTCLELDEIVTTPFPTESPDLLSRSFSASQLINDTLQFLREQESARELTLHEELQAAIRSRGADHTRVESAFPFTDSSSSLSSKSSGSEGLLTPHANRSFTHSPVVPDTTSDGELARSLQEVYDQEAIYEELERLQIKYDRDLAREIQKEEGVIRHVSTKRTLPVVANVTDTGMGRAKSITTRIESTSPLLEPSVRRGRQELQVTGRKRHCTLPIGSTESGQAFIPSGRSFEPVRQPLTHGPHYSMERSNAVSLDIEQLRHELRPTRTGDRVRHVVEQFETRSRGPSLDSTRPSTPVMASNKVFESRQTVSSDDLSREAKLMMAEARQRRRLHRAM